MEQERTSDSQQQGGTPGTGCAGGDVLGGEQRKGTAFHLSVQPDIPVGAQQTQGAPPVPPAQQHQPSPSWEQGGSAC